MSWFSDPGTTIKRAAHWSNQHAGTNFNAGYENLPPGPGPSGLGSIGAGRIPSVGSYGMPSGAQSMPQRGGFSMPSFGGVGDKIKGVGAWLMKNPDLLLALASGVEGFQENKRANRLTDESIDSARRRQAMGAEAADRLQKLQRPDLSDIYTDPGNPYARRRIPAVGSQR